MCEIQSKMAQKFKPSSGGCRRGVCSNVPVIWVGKTGRFAEIATLIHQGPGVVKHVITKWTPSIDYEFIASKMDKESSEAYLKKSKEWFENLPVKHEVAPIARVEVNSDLMIKLYKKHAPHKPPTEETLETMREAGYPAEALNRVIKDAQWWDENSDQLQKNIDKIFGTAPTKPTAKKVKKVIKAVKKRAPSN